MDKYNTTKQNFTLEQFIDFLISPSYSHPGKVYFDRHWDAYTRSCRTRSETYTYVTRTETSADDSGPILRLLEYPEDYLRRSSINRNHIERPNKSPDNRDTAKKQQKSVLSPPAFGKYLEEFENIPVNVMKN